MLLDIAELELPRGPAGLAAFRIRLQSAADLLLKAIPSTNWRFFFGETSQLPV